jgi:uncharacterized protein YbjQ (UPF0145 family)
VCDHHRVTSAPRLCGCGLIKQSKVGSTLIDDVESCNSCRLPIAPTPTAIAAAAAPVVRPEFVTTLPTLPGYRIVRVVGVVTELAATSGLTAAAKGTSALERGMAALRSSAAAMHANAIIGLTGSSFGAAGGITSAFGGDAVGVLLIGTAAVVELTGDPLDPSSLN